MATYIEVDMRLDSLDLVMISGLLEKRIDELVEFKKENPAWFSQNIADEQLHNYRATMKKIKAARSEVRKIKKESDAAFSETQRKMAEERRKSARRTTKTR